MRYGNRKDLLEEEIEMKKLLERRKSCWGIGIVAALIFLVVMGTINVNVISNKIAKLNLEKNDSAQAYKVFSNDDKKTQSSNVEFLAFFMNDGRKMNGIDAKVSSGANLYFSLNVMNEGYLKNGKITLS